MNTQYEVFAYSGDQAPDNVKLPKGMVGRWSGPRNEAPDHWVRLCDNIPSDGDTLTLFLVKKYEGVSA